MTAAARSMRHLVGVEVRAFGRARPAGWFGRLTLTLGSSVALFAFERRIHPSGGAVCLLGARPGRVALGIGGFWVALVAVGGASRPAAAALLAAIAVLSLPSALRATIELPAQLRLRRATPSGRRVYLHSLASVEPGAGAELMRLVAREADEKGWSLVLDAGNQELARYYRRFGFVAPWGDAPPPAPSRRVHMWRPVGGATDTERNTTPSEHD